MNLSLLLLLVSVDPEASSASKAMPAAPTAVAPSSSNNQTDERIEKEVVYQKEQVVDLSGTEVQGERQLPPAFFVTKSETTNARSLLEERLRFELRNYNRMGF